MLFFAAGLSLFQMGTAYAVIANPEPIIYTQPDGSKLTIVLKGDEFIHWAMTSDGYTVMTNAKGTYEYAAMDNLGNLVFSGIQANEPAGRKQPERAWLEKTEKGLFFSTTQVNAMKIHMANSGAPQTPLMGGFPVSGSRKLLMILANFSNTSTTYGQANFDNYMNQVNYNGTGSFRDYYIEVSYGQLTVNTSVTVWVTLPNTHDFYGPQSNWGQFAYDAIVAANNQTSVNFAEYDNDQDGTVDGIAIIHQGQGQEETGNSLDIWSHSWDLSSAGYSGPLRTFDGVQVDAYTAMPERNATGMGTIGVICHEFCHNLGAPDFYDTDYATGGSYTGTGKWDLMAGGSWNGTSGTKPAHPNPWVKAYFNWTTPAILTTVQNVTLRNAQAFPDVVRYNTQTPNEYFLCENRQQTGFDSGIPGHGLIIYHVDGSYISTHINSNNINASEHQGLYPVCANAIGNPAASYGTINGTGCPFPGTGNKTAFTDVTTPHAHSWASLNTDSPVSNIFEYAPAREVSFCFLSCYTPQDPAGFAASASSSSQINLSWTLNSMNNPVMIAYSMTPCFGTPVNGSSYTAGGSIPGGGTVIYSGTNSNYSHTGLNASITYYYKAWSILSDGIYSPGVSARATTFCGTITSFPWNEGFENAGSIPGCWTQEQVNNSGISWIFPAGNGVNNPAAAHTGTYNACLKDKTAADNKSRLISPALDLTSSTNPRLTFWHTQPAWGTDQDQLSVYYKTSAGGTWTLLASYNTSIASWSEETINLPNPTATYYIAFEGNAKFGYGICIDDVQVANGCSTYVPVSISIHTSLNMICAGTAVTDSSVACNGGTSPCYQWRVGGINVAGATNPTYTHAPTGNEEVSCVLTSSATCLLNNPAASNVINRTVNPLLTAGITISVSANPVSTGTPVTFTASPVNGGTAPVYQWHVNGIDVNGVNSGVFTYSPADGDSVRCTMWSDVTCLTSNPVASNPITISVTSIPTSNTVQNLNINDVRCFDAIHDVVVAGEGATFTILDGGIVTIIAGERILFMPGTTVNTGGYMLGYITTTGEFCNSNGPSIPNATGPDAKEPESPVQADFKTFPNPTDGEFVLQFNGSVMPENVKVDIFGMTGNRLSSSWFTGKKRLDLSLSGQPAGIYLVKVSSGNIQETTRIIKR